MGVEEADRLQQMLEQAGPGSVGASEAGQPGNVSATSFMSVGSFGQSQRDIALWVAIREGDRERIKSYLKWPADREYRIDPLGERIAWAYSDLLFGEDPEFKAGVEGDQDNLDEIIESNDLPSELRRWVADCVSEGEVWWRVFVDRSISEWPIVDSASRLNTVPLFVGRRIAAVAFIDEIVSQQIRLENSVATEFYRHVEIQTDGLVRNLLYKGGWQNLGRKCSLSETPETKDLEDEWNHGLPVMLAGRFPNKLGRDWRLGISEFHGIKDLLLDLNEAHTIMAENARLTSKSRMVVPASALDENGQFDAGKDVIVAESMDEALDDKKSGPYAVLEYKFQADELLRHMDNLVAVSLTRVGLAEQFIGGSRSGGQGQAFTGTALRTRLIPTTLAASGKGRYWDDGTPKMLLAMQMVSALPVEQGGTGQSWQDAKTAPSMERDTVLPEDEGEETQRHVMAVQGEIESIYMAVKGLHPDWSDDDIKDEIDRIHEDRNTGLGVASQDNIPAAQDLGHGTNPADPRVPEPGGKGLADARGTRQPGTGRGRDGQSPGKTPPAVKLGGPK